jgi:hypothetical protein
MSVRAAGFFRKKPILCTPLTRAAPDRDSAVTEAMAIPQPET